MKFTSASFHFATGTLYVHQDGYLSGAADTLRAMLLEVGAVSAEAFERGNFGQAYWAKDPAGDSKTSFRYTFEGENVRAEQRLTPGQEQWKEIYAGSVLALVNAHGPMLHALGANPLWPGATLYATLEKLEAQYAQTEARRLRHEAGVVTLGGQLATEQAATLRQQLLSALRAEVANGQVEPIRPASESGLKTYTVIAEIWENEQGYSATVQAVDEEAAADLVQQQYRQLVAAQSTSADNAGEAGEQDEETDLLRIWAVLKGAAEVAYLREAA